MLKSFIPCCLLIVSLAFSTSCETAEKTQKQAQETTSETATPSDQVEEAAEQLSITPSGPITNSDLKIELHNLSEEIYSKIITIKEGIKGGSSTDEAADRKVVSELTALASELDRDLVSIGSTPEDQWSDFSQKVLAKVAEAKRLMNKN